MKIRVIGTTGSGKTFLARKLSKKLKIPAYDLDDIYWIKKYSKKLDVNNPADVKKILKKVENITKKNSWIIEGLQYNIENASVKKSDLIIWINPPLIKIIPRLLKRTNARDNEKIIDVLKLIKSAIKYKLNLNSQSKKAHLNYYNIYKKKYAIVKNNRELNDLIKNLK